MDIRPWQVEDADALRPMLMDFLRDTSAQGSKILPTADNASLLLKIGLSHPDDPVLIAVAADFLPVGFVLWVGGQPAFEFQSRACLGLGTYVVPSWRRKGVSRALRSRAREIARQRGYGHVEGLVFAPDAMAASLAAGFQVVGQQVELRL